MANKNEPAGPSISSVIFVGILTFVLGAALGTSSLISQPVLTLNKDPDPESIKPGTVYYVRGDRIGRTAWRAKEDAWKSGLVEELSLSEAELNQWSQTRLDIEDDTPQEERDSWSNRLKLEVEPANFRLVGDEVQISTQIRFKGVLEDKTFHYQIFGRFEPTERGVHFVAERGTLGCAAVGNVPGLKKWAFGYITGLYKDALDLAWLGQSLSHLEAAEITDGQLVLRRKSAG